MKKETATYTLARLPIGFSFLGHGFIRIPKLQEFSEGMSSSFSETVLPYFFVKPFALALPFIELVLGIALILGFKAKTSSAIGVGLVCLLIFGSSFQENWSSVATQMFYGLYLSLLYYFSDYNQPLFNK